MYYSLIRRAVQRFPDVWMGGELGWEGSVGGWGACSWNRKESVGGTRFVFVAYVFSGWLLFSESWEWPTANEAIKFQAPTSLLLVRDWFWLAGNAANTKEEEEASHSFIAYVGQVRDRATRLWHQIYMTYTGWNNKRRSVRSCMLLRRCLGPLFLIVL